MTSPTLQQARPASSPPPNPARAGARLESSGEVGALNRDARERGRDARQAGSPPRLSLAEGISYGLACQLSQKWVTRTQGTRDHCAQGSRELRGNATRTRATTHGTRESRSVEHTQEHARESDASGKGRGHRWRSHAQREMRTSWRRAVTRRGTPTGVGGTHSTSGKGIGDTKGISEGHTAASPCAQKRTCRLHGCHPCTAQDGVAGTAGVHAHERAAPAVLPQSHYATPGDPCLRRDHSAKGRYPPGQAKAATPPPRWPADTAGTSASGTRDARTHHTPTEGVWKTRSPGVSDAVGLDDASGSPAAQGVSVHSPRPAAREPRARTAAAAAAAAGAPTEHQAARREATSSRRVTWAGGACALALLPAATAAAPQADCGPTSL